MTSRRRSLINLLSLSYLSKSISKSLLILHSLEMIQIIDNLKTKSDFPP